MKKLNVSLKQFDDYETDEYATWAPICTDCVKRLDVPDNLLDEAGSGICGIAGCWNTAEFYLDFPKDHTEAIS